MVEQKGKHRDSEEKVYTEEQIKKYKFTMEKIYEVLDMFAEIRNKTTSSGRPILSENESLYREIDLKVDGLPEEIIKNIGKEFWDKVPDWYKRIQRISEIPDDFIRIRQELSQRFGLSEDLITGIINRYLKLYAEQDKYGMKEKYRTQNEGNSGRFIYGRHCGDVGRALLWRKIR